MKRRKRIRADLPTGDAALLMVLGALFLAGGSVGCIAAGNIRGEAGSALRDYLQTYLTLAGEEGGAVTFAGTLWEQLSFPICTLLMGFAAAGVAGIPALFAVKGFTFAFSVSCFCRLFGWAGLGPAAFLFGLPALLWAPALFVLGTQAMGSSLSMLRKLLGEERLPAFCEGGYWMRCALCAAALALCVALEYLALPALVGASARFIL